MFPKGSTELIRRRALNSGIRGTCTRFAAQPVFRKSPRWPRRRQPARQGFFFPSRNCARLDEQLKERCFPTATTARTVFLFATWCQLLLGRGPASSLPFTPVKGTAVQVHHRFDVNGIWPQTVNDGVREAVEVELAIVAPD